MNRLGDRPAAAERGRWLAELAETIDQALRLARTVSVSRGSCVEAEDIYGRLELVRIEVEDLRRGGWGSRPTRFNPLWTSLFPWNGHPEL